MRCYFPEDFLNCYPWPVELGIFETTLHKIKCRERTDNQQEGEDLCVVVGDRGGVYVTGSGFSPMSEKGGTELGLDTVNLTPTLTPTLALALALTLTTDPDH